MLDSGRVSVVSYQRRILLELLACGACACKLSLDSFWSVSDVRLFSAFSDEDDLRPFLSLFLEDNFEDDDFFLLKTTRVFNYHEVANVT